MEGFNVLKQEGYNGFFECANEAEGVVIGWEEATLNNPKCWR